MMLANNDGDSTAPQKEDAESHWPPESAHLMTVFAYASWCIIIDVGGGGEDCAGGGTYEVVGGGTYEVVGGGTYSVVGYGV